VFIDDLPRNVAAAEARGWHAIHHRDAAPTRDGLRAIGVRLPRPFAPE
jgi:FMN phosphatase YigB (HAD superfamily)